MLHLHDVDWIVSSHFIIINYGNKNSYEYFSEFLIICCCRWGLWTVNVNDVLPSNLLSKIFTLIDDTNERKFIFWDLCSMLHHKLYSYTAIRYKLSWIFFIIPEVNIVNALNFWRDMLRNTNKICIIQNAVHIVFKYVSEQIVPLQNLETWKVFKTLKNL